jgi:hypothetical protein
MKLNKSKYKVFSILDIIFIVMSSYYESSKMQEENFKKGFNVIDRVKQMEAVQKEGLELFKRKNADYGDAFANYGPVGVIVRIGDKIYRLSSVSKNSVSLVNNESLRDTLIDLHNYAAMAIMLMDEVGLELELGLGLRVEG